MSAPSNSRRSSAVRNTCIYAMLASLMFCSKIIMEALPNVHLLGVLTMVYTVALGSRALIPLYLYVIINGVYAGFATWWIPYLYVWTVLWLLTMLIPRRLPRRARAVIYPLVCSLFGFAFGTLYAPGQALLYGMSLQATLAWIVSGLPFDVIHGVSNLFTGMLILPLSTLLTRLMK